MTYLPLDSELFESIVENIHLFSLTKSNSRWSWNIISEAPPEDVKEFLDGLVSPKNHPYVSRFNKTTGIGIRFHDPVACVVDERETDLDFSCNRIQAWHALLTKEQVEILHDRIALILL